MRAALAIVIVIYVATLLLTQLTPRDDSIHLLLFYTSSFLAFIFLCFNSKIEHKKLIFLLGIGVLARFIFIFFPPLLSDDYFRFIWDGNIWLDGINPFEATPTYLLNNSHSEWMDSIYQDLNSKEFFTVYPAVCQYLSWFSVSLIPGSIKAVYCLKALIFISELGTLILIWKLLEHFQSAKSNILIYALNPLVIIETVGNVHFEAIAILFILASIYCTLKNRFLIAGVIFAFAIGTKLTPLMIIPFFLFSLKRRNFLLSGVTCLLTLFVIHIPFLEYMPNTMNSLALYFDYFEFNASIYYLAKTAFVEFDIYDWFEKFKLVLPFCVIVMSVSMQYFLRDKKLKSFGSVIIISWLLYFLFASTVHPWYILIMIAGAVFSKFKFPVVWSFIIFLSYSAYYFEPLKEIKWLILLEYVLLLSVIFFEYIKIQEPKYLINS